MEIKKLSELTGFDQSSFIPNEELRENLRSTMNKVLPLEEEIEKNRNKVDLKPNVDFVQNNLNIYNDRFNSFLKKEDQDNIMKIEFDGSGEITKDQISEERISKMIQSIPYSLRKISDLKKVLYFDLALVPHFKEDGNFDEIKGVDQIPVSDFPRKEDHPSRLMIGATSEDGENIFMTPIPNSVSENQDAVNHYQNHIFLHEFFHSIERAKRDPEVRKKIIFSFNNQEFSFQDWWKAFEELILSEVEPICVSSYANTYFHDLTTEMKTNNPNKFTHALAEQICETFVAYILNIISNDTNWIDFKSESFGNKTISPKNEIDPKNMKWILMNKLYNANLVRIEN
jgi:hypothetical protein